LGVQLPSRAIASTFDTLTIAGRQVSIKKSAADFEWANAKVFAANTKVPETAKMVNLRMGGILLQSAFRNSFTVEGRAPSLAMKSRRRICELCAGSEQLSAIKVAGKRCYTTGQTAVSVLTPVRV
jgi:hypothetical protein